MHRPVWDEFPVVSAKRGGISYNVPKHTEEVFLSRIGDWIVGSIEEENWPSTITYSPLNLPRRKRMWGRKNAYIKELTEREEKYYKDWSKLYIEQPGLNSTIDSLKSKLSDLSVPFKVWTVNFKGDQSQDVHAQFEYEADGWYLFQKATPTGREVVDRFRSKHVISVHRKDYDDDF